MTKADVLKVAFIQFNIEWENDSANLIRLSSIINNSAATFDLLVLPEMFHCGFTMKPQNSAQTMDGPVIQWMKATAALKQCAICGGVVVVEDGQFYNRLIFVDPNGEIQFYNKRHLFRMSGEHEIYKAGSSQVVIDFKGWRIMPLICYDLRFPVWSRNVTNCDLMIYIANWPTPRRDAWNILLKARAIENQCYVMGVNHVGTDPFVAYSGDSAIIDAKGIALDEAFDNVDVLHVVDLECKTLDVFRSRFPVLLDRDEFKII